jgi:UDP-GlcNAc3NAcA epimerase
LKIVTVLGARPQFIKAGSVSREILRQQQAGQDLQEVIVHTGQHYDSNMSDVFFQEMQIPKPQYALGIGGQSHGAMTGRMLEQIETVLQQESPDWVLVYGDTNSTLAGALAAAKMSIPVAHVEAGLRSFNLRMPEEINRILTDRISRLLLCPTTQALENLRAEGIEQWRTGAQSILCGDVMLDGALFYQNLAVRPPELVGVDSVAEGSFVLVTIHRAENTDDPQRLQEILAALREISRQVPIVFPVHPRTRKIIANLDLDTSNLILLDPVGYLNMVWLIKHANLVMTDSGGLQKEAFFFRKHCITLRDETEWTELVEHRFNVLAGATRENIVQAFADRPFSQAWEQVSYGGGQASQRVVESILQANRGTTLGHGL